jgi:ribosomal protein S18 acetylase RimI-like enzyme
MGFQFEPATDNDWPRIIEWQAEIEWVGLPRVRQRGISHESVRDRLRERMARLRADQGFPNEVLVARAPQGDLAGYVWVAKTHNDRTGRVEASLLGQFVAPAYRDRGLGAQLLELAEDWARQQGLPCLGLHVSASNSIAQRLYRSLGYEVEALRMTKILGPISSGTDGAD